MPPPTDLLWTPAGPRSRRFDDIYFSVEDGLAESRAVFLRGCGLPDAWRGRRRFTVGELGFGTGLNILALLDLWRRDGPPDARLHVFSVEAYPLARDDAARALAAWPELAGLAARLLSRWPSGDGLHRIDWPELGATLDLAHAPSDEALARWTGLADAWFLDGFAPALNPDMWSPALLGQVATRSRPGARVATFTVAGAVRRGLAAAGFDVSKQPGFGRKRERLEAVLPGVTTDVARPRVAVVGAGVAGAALMRAFRSAGCEPVLVAPADGEGPPAALVSPRFDAGAGPAARLTLQAFRRAVALYADLPDAVIARGLIQLEAADRDARRFDALASGALFAPGEVERLTSASVADMLGEPATRGLQVRDAVVLRPAVVRDAWSAGAERIDVRVAEILRTAEGVRLQGADGRTLADVDIVVVAAGWASLRLLPSLPLRPVRGQVSWAALPGDAPPAAAWGGYVVPTGGGVLFGATHDRDRQDAGVDPADHLRNRATLAARLPALAGATADVPLQGWAGIRAVTPDRLPLAGAVAPGVHVLAGLGSRGWTTAPLLAEHVAAEALGAPSPLPKDFAALVQPGRFAGH